MILKGHFVKETYEWVLKIPSHDLEVQSIILLQGLKGMKAKVKELDLVDNSECFLMIQDGGVFHIEVRTKEG